MGTFLTGMVVQRPLCIVYLHNGTFVRTISSVRFEISWHTQEGVLVVVHSWGLTPVPEHHLSGVRLLCHVPLEKQCCKCRKIIKDDIILSSVLYI